MNKPVAWMIKTLDGRKLMLYGEEQPPKFEQEVESIPLYTHPAPTKVKFASDSCESGWIYLENAYPAELTDEEILDIADNFPFIENGVERIEFAKAILRKAQEK